MKKYFVSGMIAGLCCLLTARAQEPIFRMDFDSPAKVGTFEKEITLPESGYVKGKTGRGYFFERPAKNFLPADVAIPTNPQGFEPGNGSKVELKNGVLTLNGDRLTIRSFTTEFSWDFIYKTTALTGSCEIKGPKGTKVTLTVKLAPWNIPEKRKQEILKKSKKKHPLIEDKTVPMTYTLTGEWQKIAAYAELDSRSVTERSATMEISSDSKQIFNIRKLQAEHTMRYPYKTYAPTSFLPGKTSRQPDVSGIKLSDSWIQNNFPYENGTVTFWLYLPSAPQLKRPDGTYFGFARGWHHPMWNLRKNAGSTGLKTGVYLKKGIPVNQWVHVAMAWDQEKSYLYLDGKLILSPARKKSPVNGKEKYILTIGRTQWTTESADGIMDDFMIFGKVLSENEIKTIISSQDQTKTQNKSSFRIKPFLVQPFFRDDPKAGISIEIESEKAAKISAEIISFETIKRDFQLKKGLNRIFLPFHPAKMSPGKGKLKITLSSSEGTFLNYETDYTIFKAVRRDLMRILSWGGYRPTPLPYLQSLGINAINTTPERDMEEATKLGMLVNLDFRNHKELVRYNYDVAKTMKATADDILKMRGRYNWYGTLLNSEAYMYWNNFASWKNTNPYLYNLARKKFTPFPDLSLIRVSPHMVKIDELNPKPDAQGLYEKPGPGYHFLNWYKNEGTPVIGLNTAGKKLISSADPDNLVWVEPPYSVGQFKGMDMGGVWTYIVTLQEVVGKLRREWSTIRQAGCPYIQPTLTMYYWINSKERAVYNGKDYFLIRSVDQLKSNCWAAAGAVGMHDLCFFNAYAWYDSEKENKDYIPSSDLSKRFGKFMREEFYPAALLLRDTKEPPATVALYLPPESMVYSEKSWNLYRTTCMWERNLALYNIHFDLISADTPYRKPESYKTLIIPMMKYASKGLHQKLLDISSKTRIVVDKDCPRTYPGMLKLDYKHNPGRPYDQDTFKTIIPFLKELEQQGTGRSFRAVGTKGDVMYFERIHKGVRYLLVINNLWTEDEISACAVDKKPRGFALQPKGVLQGAKITVDDAANSQIYQFKTGRKVSFRKDGKKAVFETELQPGNAELFCVYPAPLTDLKMEIKGSPEKGKITLAELTLKDNKGKFAPGRQIIFATVTDGSGKNTDETGWYVMEEGKVEIPVRIGLDAPSGKWTISVREHTTKLRVKQTFQLK